MYDNYSLGELKDEEEITNSLLIHLEFLESPIENISTVIPEYDIRINEISQDDLHNYYYFLKMQCEDLEKIKNVLEIDLRVQKDDLKTHEISIEDIEREIKIADKEKIEMSHEKKKIEEELLKLKEDGEIEMNLSKVNTNTLPLSKSSNSGEQSHFYSNYKSIDLSNIKNELNSYNTNSSSGSSQLARANQKEKQKKLKELKSNLYRLEKSLQDAKKFYQEKNLRNDLFIRENEALNETLKYKVQIAEQIRSEIQDLNINKDPRNSKITQDNSYYTRSTGVTDNASSQRKIEKKGSFMGFVKNIFKK